jgi:predicted RNase H-like HicB family nuclease
MNEVIFLVEDSAEGGYEAHALGKAIFTEGETLDELKQNIREAVRCHFDEGTTPSIIRLHYVKEEMISL